MTANCGASASELRDYRSNGAEKVFRRIPSKGRFLAFVYIGLCIDKNVYSSGVVFLFVSTPSKNNSIISVQLLECRLDSIFGDF